MKCPKGFRGKYFSLAAILALNATVTIANETQSAVDIEAKMTPKEFASSEEETPPLELVPVVVVSKKIKEKKSEVYTTSKSLVNVTNVTDNVSIITSEELSLKGITSVTEALSTISGISITSSGSLGTTQSIFM
ncbi:MAG: TonB-dependent receptor plug domain-containing protein, partial [Campylobacteraceae bacterium]|nr:TonB-dependent receptor plug domain-containing protein [Campylobacteraceae bacterium]